MKNVTLIGSGNVAWHLASGLNSCGYTIDRVISRNAEHAMELASLYHCPSADFHEPITLDSPLTFICIKDDALEDIKKSLPSTKGIVCHVSGTKPLDALQGISANTGVFYPLQTFSKFRTVDWKQVPIFIEASNEFTATALGKIAQELSGKSYELNGEQRAWLHLSAVLANNFTNHLLAAAEQILRDHRQDFAHLLPLLRETIERTATALPSTMQTGPARRNDALVIQEHLHMLKDYPEIAELYQTFTRQIQEKYHRENT